MGLQSTKRTVTKEKPVKEDRFSYSELEYCGFCGWGVKRLDDGTPVHASSLGERGCDGQPPVVHSRRAPQPTRGRADG